MAGFRRGICAAALAFFAGSAQAANAGPCATDRFAGAHYTVCTVDATKNSLRLFWKDGAGEPYRNFSNLAEAVAKQGRSLAFAINAGMYRPDFSPLGLFIADAKEQSPIQPAGAKTSDKPVPNFYKKPNGIFFLGESGAGLLPTEQFVKHRPKVWLATQSGPMLVIENRLNPIFIIGSADKTRRSGVGVCKDGVIHFVVSDDAVNFHDFARFFRDRLECPNALFLDGGGGAGLYDPALGRNDMSWHGGYGPMFALIE
ncbi:phosphodiester glycosidase family protein [Brucella sp. 2716]|uniref:phosphodiester glycosidase family protein n=1 Tax=Brucella sp. 2716 TaxID=2975052 RepID=UPI00217F01CE|nr:phosphodiester glycosidase family protein [Brucella sp. 2716]UWF58528.1 phosphodiester glycosidase family protein [Brucella sp. 2716]